MLPIFYIVCTLRAITYIAYIISCLQMNDEKYCMAERHSLSQTIVYMENNKYSLFLDIYIYIYTEPLENHSLLICIIE